MSDLDNLLDLTLDDLEDLPSFGSFPPGAYRVLATLGSKTVNDKPAVELSLKMVEVIELSTASDEAPAAGDQASTLFFTDNEIGRGKLKECAVVFAELVGSRNLRAIIEGVTDIECVVFTTYSKNKNDPDSPYMNVKEIQVV